MLRPEPDAIPAAPAARGTGNGFADSGMPLDRPRRDRGAAGDRWERCLGWLRRHGVA